MVSFKTILPISALLLSMSHAADLVVTSCSVVNNNKQFGWSISWNGVPPQSEPSVCGNFGGNKGNNGVGWMQTIASQAGCPVEGGISCSTNGAEMNTNFVLGGELSCADQAVTIKNAMQQTISSLATVQFDFAICSRLGC
ncbi:hypothetical protein T310_0975 [Rasamsonia emersonii CBS 393.64]|uniref:Secreted protein n=1 Tax=Rasamsonia emersonii (strain ATCC 16479 / CBS 393.64 / IMI 116815) TaxID=1408163 RepID=A0A0F4Z386_RASE3|nr:hypothetical protein T310_0975 [Rasamsonia emersonii CBS 393.64]KKA24994.1 hypothetical protein T310_0975 [Rasamsonia emersonii CBS 393.64]